MDKNFAQDQMYCSGETYNNEKNKNKKFTQAIASQQLNVSIYDNCLVFNKLAFDIFKDFTKAVIKNVTDNGFDIVLNDNNLGCNINKKGAQPRLNIPELVLKYNLKKGKFRYTKTDNVLYVDYCFDVDKYDNGYVKQSHIEY